MDLFWLLMARPVPEGPPLGSRVGPAIGMLVFSFSGDSHVLGALAVLCMLYAKPPQSCLTLCNPMDHSRPGSSVHGILQARILEWVAMPSSRGSSRPRDRTCISCISCLSRQVLYHQCHLGSPSLFYPTPQTFVENQLIEETKMG